MELSKDIKQEMYQFNNETDEQQHKFSFIFNYNAHKFKIDGQLDSSYEFQNYAKLFIYNTIDHKYNYLENILPISKSGNNPDLIATFISLFLNKQIFLK